MKGTLCTLWPVLLALYIVDPLYRDAQCTQSTLWPVLFALYIVDPLYRDVQCNQRTLWPELFALYIVDPLHRDVQCTQRTLWPVLFARTYIVAPLHRDVQCTQRTLWPVLFARILWTLSTEMCSVPNVLSDLNCLPCTLWTLSTDMLWSRFFLSSVLIRITCPQNMLTNRDTGIHAARQCQPIGICDRRYNKQVRDKSC